MPVLLAALATIALVLAAAKAHGRQVRLEREQQGYFRVDFGAQNPAAVEAIWRADRRLFWLAFAGLGVAGLVWVYAANDLALAAFVGAWAFAGGFSFAGLASWVRVMRRKQGPAPCRQRAIRGSIGWWLVVLAAAALVALAF
ncbi:MAG: hypothetical protein WC876_11905 [Candidatus Thermoplasmatota archaeon]